LIKLRPVRKSTTIGSERDNRPQGASSYLGVPERAVGPGSSVRALCESLAAPADAALDELGLRGLVDTLRAGRKRTDRALALALEARTEILPGAGTRAPGQEPVPGR